MKWLILQSAGHHNGTDNFTKNDHMRECFAIQHALRQNNQEADIWGKRHPNFATPPDFNSYDYIFLLENYEFEGIPDLSQFRKPKKLQWIIDLHFQQTTYVPWSMQCDIILHSTKALIHEYKWRVPGKRHLWFPNGVDDLNFTYNQQPKLLDIVFVGSLMNRGSFLQVQQIPHVFATGKDMIDTIASTKIHFNKPISCDVNYRNFETIGIGTCLLTQQLQELEELGFKDNENCLMYQTSPDCSRKLKESLASGSWKDIALRGHEFSKTQTYTKRIETLLTQL